MIQLLLGDNLQIMNDLKDNIFDLIYLDPPFMSQRNYGSFDDRWEKGKDNYLRFMYPRLIEMERVLKPEGSLYLHCDTNASHYLRLILDYIFGMDKFRNEIVWCYAPAGRAPKRSYHRKHDVILYYADRNKGVWNAPYTEMNPKSIPKYNHIDDDGRRWGYIHGKKRYMPKGRPVPDWWDDIPSFQAASKSSERVGYPTQKPLKILERIIKASTNEGDAILDPFCGSGTSLVAAYRLGRNYTGIDCSEEAIAVSKERLENESRKL